MTTFRMILAFLVISAAIVGCHTPLIDIKINEGSASVNGDDSGGACRRPRICSGGATFGQVHTGQIVKVGQAVGILGGEPEEVEYFMVDDPGVTLEPGLALKEGTIVSITTTEGKVVINKKQE